MPKKIVRLRPKRHGSKILSIRVHRDWVEVRLRLEADRLFKQLRNMGW